ncbi:MAG TPA: type IV pilus modification protein PilV [Haliangiales bacterium]|nr:type IV pilus modification protein PilV [Haliangiales bacterium]
MRDGERGFTVMEVLIALVVLTIGMLGIMALQGTAVKANRVSRELEQARVFTSQMMEDLRGRPVAGMGTGGTYPTMTTPDGTVYTRTFTVATLPSEPNLRLITVTTSFDEDGDPSQRHTSTLQVLRTLQEAL